MTEPGATDARYPRVEYERRFLVDPGADWASSVEPYTKLFADTYFRDTRLRLRVLTDLDTGRQVIKLKPWPGGTSGNQAAPRARGRTEMRSSSLTARTSAVLSVTRA